MEVKDEYGTRKQKTKGEGELRGTRGSQAPEYLYELRSRESGSAESVRILGKRYSNAVRG